MPEGRDERLAGQTAESDNLAPDLVSLLFPVSTTAAAHVAGWRRGCAKR